MRHTDRIYALFSDAIRRAAEEGTLTEQLPQQNPHARRAIGDIWHAAERRGAYAVIDRMLYRFGRYKLADCTDDELSETLEVINACLVPPPRRMHLPRRPSSSSQTEEQQ